MPKFMDNTNLGFDEFKGVIDNKGLYVDSETNVEEHLSLTDTLSHPNATEFFPIVVNTTIREAIEPIDITSAFFERIDYKVGMATGGFAVGAVTAADIAEDSEYPSVSLEFGGGTSHITIGKSGIALRFTEEMQRYQTNFDYIALYLKKMAQALARHKAKKAFGLFSAQGVVTHDNLNPGSSVFGATTGYGYNGKTNGGISMDDIWEAFGHAALNGFNVNTMVVHPLTYTMFMTDPVMRAFALASGGGQWYNGYNGNIQNTYPWARPHGKLGVGGTETFDPKTTNMTSTPKIPDYLGIPLQIIASPMVPYNHVTKLTDIYLVDSANVGAIFVDEEPTWIEVEDKIRDTKMIKIRERYAFALYNEGKAISTMKNVKVVPNKLVLPPTVNLSSWTEVTRSSATVNSDGVIQQQ